MSEYKDKIKRRAGYLASSLLGFPVSLLCIWFGVGYFLEGSPNFCELQVIKSVSVKILKEDVDKSFSVRGQYLGQTRTLYFQTNTGKNLRYSSSKPNYSDVANSLSKGKSHSFWIYDSGNKNSIYQISADNNILVSYDERISSEFRGMIGLCVMGVVFLLGSIYCWNKYITMLKDDKKLLIQ